METPLALIQVGELLHQESTTGEMTVADAIIKTGVPGQVRNVGTTTGALIAGAGITVSLIAGKDPITTITTEDSTMHRVLQAHQLLWLLQQRHLQAGRRRQNEMEIGILT